MVEAFSPELILEQALAVRYSSITMPEWKQAGINVVLRRDDLIDERLSGNKFYKLYYNLKYAIETGKAAIVSYGGAYSNHLYALAAAGSRFNIQTLGIVRGERAKVLSPTLQDAESMGMQLQFVSRNSYQKHTTRVQVSNYPTDYHVIPEGGANQLGIEGTGVIGTAINKGFAEDYDFVCVACGTGGTMMGIIGNLPSHKTVVGFSVLKGNDVTLKAANNRVVDLNVCRWRIIRGFHGGGYARKLPNYLVDFWRKFELTNKILLDPVYTLKMLWGIHVLAVQGYWPRGSQLIAVHTGGLQGRRGFVKQINW